MSSTNSFEQFGEKPRAARPWVIIGLVVLLAALIPALATAVIGLTQAASPSEETAPATVTVTAEPAVPAGDSVPAPGGYEGTMTSAADGSSWPAVFTFGGGDGMLVYPTTGCTVALSQGEEAGVYQSQALVSDCSAGGEWTVRAADNETFDVTYTGTNGAETVTGTIAPAVSASATN